MNQKIKLFILSALLIQGCFFSSSVFSVTWYRIDSSPNWTTDYSSGCTTAISLFYASSGNSPYNPPTDYNTVDTLCATKTSFSLIYKFLLTRLNCASGKEPLTGGEICVTPVDPCLNVIDTITTTVPIDARSDGQWKDINGCTFNQVTGSPVVCDGYLCTVTATGIGSTAPPVTAQSSPISPLPTSSSPYQQTEVFPSTSTFDTSSLPPVTNPDSTITEVVTDVSTSKNNQQSSLSYDGQTTTVINSDGSITNTTTVSTTTTNPDGTSSTVSSTNSTTSSGKTDTTSIDQSTGAVTTSSVGASTTSTTSGSVTGYDSNGNITSMTFTDPVRKLTEPVDPNCPSCVSDIKNFVNGDFSTLDSSISDLSKPFIDNLEKPSFSLVLGSLGTCDNSDFSITVLSSNFNPDICSFIVILQSVLYWFFAVATGIYLFHIATNLGRLS